MTISVISRRTADVSRRVPLCCPLLRAALPRRDVPVPDERFAEELFFTELLFEEPLFEELLFEELLFAELLPEAPLPVFLVPLELPAILLYCPVPASDNPEAAGALFGQSGRFRISSYAGRPIAAGAGQISKSSDSSTG